MDFINNYSQPVTLAQGVASLALSLPDGEYRLTLTDSAIAGTRWEIVGAVVVSGTATLTRGLEGTSDQSWPEGSVIYSSLTAGILASILQRLDALEAGSTPAPAPFEFSIVAGTSSAFGNTVSGFYLFDELGSLVSTPEPFAGTSITQVFELGVSTDGTDYSFFASGSSVAAAVPGSYLLSATGIDSAAVELTSFDSNGQFIWQISGPVPAFQLWADGAEITCFFTPA